MFIILLISPFHCIILILDHPVISDQWDPMLFKSNSIVTDGCFRCREDILSAETFKSDEDKESYYRELKSAAESGWDFSSRWFILNGTNKGNIPLLNIN